MAWRNLTKTLASGNVEPISATSIKCYQAFIQPKRANAGIITVGGSAVAATEGFELSIPQANTPLPNLHLKTLGGNGFDLLTVYIKGTTGQGVSVLYEEY